MKFLSCNLVATVTPMSKIEVRDVCGLVAVAACTLLTACSADDKPAVLPSSQTVTSALPQPSSTTTSAAAASATIVPIGEVPGNANAVKALQPWAQDLVGGDAGAVVRKCWTIDPTRAQDMYADKDGILAALAQPGLDGQFTVIWKGPAETVHVWRNEIASAYACPRVAPTGSDSSLNEADARYVVRRYLSRWVGKPVNPDDTEGKYRLVCSSSPLADNPGRLTGTTAFADSEMTSKPIGSYGNFEVRVPVTNSSGVTQSIVFTLTISSDGYCIKEIGS